MTLSNKFLKGLVVLIFLVFSVAFADTDNIVKLAELELDGLELVNMTFSPDSTVLVTSYSGDTGPKWAIWETQTWTLKHVFNQAAGSFYFDSSGILYGIFDFKIEAWKDLLKPGLKPIFSIENEKDPSFGFFGFSFLGLSKDKSVLIAYGAEILDPGAPEHIYELMFIDVADGSIINRKAVDLFGIRLLDINSESFIVAQDFSQGMKILFFDSKYGDEIIQINVSENIEDKIIIDLIPYEISPDGKWLAIGRIEDCRNRGICDEFVGKVQLWDIEKKELVKIFSHKRDYQTLRIYPIFSPDSLYLLTISEGEDYQYYQADDAIYDVKIWNISQKSGSFGKEEPTVTDRVRPYNADIIEFYGYNYNRFRKAAPYIYWFSKHHSLGSGLVVSRLYQPYMKNLSYDGSVQAELILPDRYFEGGMATVKLSESILGRELGEIQLGEIDTISGYREDYFPTVILDFSPNGKWFIPYYEDTINNNIQVFGTVSGSNVFEKTYSKNICVNDIPAVSEAKVYYPDYSWQIIKDGSFSLCGSAWSSFGDIQISTDTELHYYQSPSGVVIAGVDSNLQPIDNAKGWFEQELFDVSDTSFFRFWLSGRTTERFGLAKDKLRCGIYGPEGFLREVTVSNLDISGYRMIEATPVATNQRKDLKFRCEVESDAENPTEFWIDDVEIVTIFFK